MKVLVLQASALHLGFLGCYGNAWIATPCLDRLAAESVVFDLHIADVVGSQSCWTGRMLEKGPALPDLLKSAGNSFVYLEASETTAETLHRAKHALARVAKKEDWLLWVDLPSLHPPWRIEAEEAGDESEEMPEEDDGLSETSEDDEEPTELSEDDGELAESQEEDEIPTLLPDPPIGSLDPTDLNLWERIRTTYAQVVMGLDDDLGCFLEEMGAAILDDITLIFTANRGLALGEHGVVGDYRPWPHDEVVHLPLIVRQPQAQDSGKRVFALTQPVDLAATLMDLFQVPKSSLEGRSWLPLLAGQAMTIRDSAPTLWTVGDFSERALRTLEWAFILPEVKPDQPPRPIQLYAKPEDRWEANNLIQQHLDLAEELERATVRLLPPSVAGIFVP
jgi:arylsulfatase A-like enzyme